MSPIRPADRRRYPRDWKQKSDAIRFGRAEGRCECEGECGAGHEGRCEARHGQLHPVTGSKVVLTTAHRDHEPRNCAPENLFAACQRCHLRPRRRAAQGQRGMDPRRTARSAAGAVSRNLSAPDRLRPRGWGSSVTTQVTPALLRLATRAAQVIKENGSLRNGELLAILGCDPADLNAAIPVVVHWRKADRCGDYLVAIARPGETRRSA
jgi:5-methylcytosine-specific restriction endonuclease McrA